MDNKKGKGLTANTADERKRQMTVVLATDNIPLAVSQKI